VTYLALYAAEVRAVMPPASRGADDDLLETYLEEREAWLARRLNGIPPDNIVLRGVLRDLAASAAMRKIATNDEERRAADALRDDALLRLVDEGRVGSDSLTAYVGETPW
jgi:hypothetical protein